MNSDTIDEDENQQMTVKPLNLSHDPKMPLPPTLRDASEMSTDDVHSEVGLGLWAFDFISFHFGRTLT